MQKPETRLARHAVNRRLMRAEPLNRQMPERLSSKTSIKMTKLKAKFELIQKLQNIGFTFDEAQSLRKIEMTLHRWAELECGDGNEYASWSIERDETTGKPFMVTHPHSGMSYRGRIADREAGALKRLKAIMSNHPAYAAHHQSDPRGCALYIVHKPGIIDNEGGLPRWLESNYSRGLAVCA